MEKSQPSQEAIIELGKKLVKELNLESGVDTLGKWMAHYVAELITRAEAAEGAEKEAIGKECFETILKLWDQRDQVPQINSPLKGLESAIQVLKNLNLDDHELPYFPSPLSLEDSSWEDFLKTIKAKSKKIVKLSMYASLGKKLLQEKQEWLEKNEELLSEAEVNLLRHLNFLVNQFGSLEAKREVIELQELPPLERYTSIFGSLERELEEMRQSLTNLKTTIPEK